MWLRGIVFESSIYIDRCGTMVDISSETMLKDNFRWCTLGRSFQCMLCYKGDKDEDADDAAAARLGVYRCSRLARYGRGESAG